MYDHISTADHATHPDGCGPMLNSATRLRKPLRQQIFEHVRAAGTAARADITRALNVSPGSVTTLTADLISKGMLREVEGQPQATGRGRPPVALEVVPEANLVIGIKLGDEHHSAVVSDFAGNIMGKATLPTPSHTKSAPVLVAETEALIHAALAASARSLSQIAAVGIGLGGIVDHSTGTVPWSPLLIEREVRLKDLCESRLGLPVHIDNDTNVLTLAELWFGAGRAMSDFAVVTIEHGVGMGLVLDNTLFRGTRGMGLELGHTKVELDGALCRCGQRGCLEAYLAEYGLVREAATALAFNPRKTEAPQALLEQLLEQAKSGNKPAQAIFRRAGRYLSIALSNLVQLFDPDLIILSGDRMKYDFLYDDQVLADMRDLTLSNGRPPCKVEFHAWGDFAWAQGAVALALSAVTDNALSEARTA